MAQTEDIGWLGTGVVHEGTIYICDMGGVMHCVDVQTGELLWRRRSDGGGTWSTITQTANGPMYLLQLAPRPSFVLIAQS